MIGDTDTSNEYFPDDTYDAEIETADTSWKLAAASMAESLAVVLEQRVTSFAATGDLSLGWSDRTRSLRALAVRLRQEAADDAITASGSLVSIALQRDASTRAEYRASSRYRQLRR
jgi:hypothetical protein